MAWSGRCAKDYEYIFDFYNDAATLKFNKLTKKQFEDLLAFQESRLIDIRAETRSSRISHIIAEILAVFKGIFSIISPLNDKTLIFQEEPIKKKILGTLSSAGLQIQLLRRELEKEGLIEGLR